LFGNPYDLRFVQGAASVALVAFLFWLKKFELFERALTLPVILVVASLPLLMLDAFLTGRADGYHALMDRANIYKLKLKDASDETTISVLRLLSEGVIARALDNQKVLFYRWDWIEALTLEFATPDPRSFVCRLVNFDCPKASLATTPSK
jgi:hypothetical protein